MRGGSPHALTLSRRRLEREQTGSGRGDSDKETGGSRAEEGATILGEGEVVPVFAGPRCCGMAFAVRHRGTDRVVGGGRVGGCFCQEAVGCGQEFERACLYGTPA